MSMAIFLQTVVLREVNKGEFSVVNLLDVSFNDLGIPVVDEQGRIRSLADVYTDLTSLYCLPMFEVAGLDDCGFFVDMFVASSEECAVEACRERRPNSEILAVLRKNSNEED